MKMPFHRSKPFALAAVAAALASALTFAATKSQKTDVSEHGIRLILGLHDKKVAVDLSHLGKALDNLDEDQYNVLHNGKPVNGKPGKLKLVKVTDPDTGGAPTETKVGIAAGGGVNVTQQTSFYSVEELQGFVDTLTTTDATPAATP